MTKHKSQDERRTQILHAAMECFVRNGFAHTRVDDIAKEAGLSKGGIYFHFKSKREIFDALQHQEVSRTINAVREVDAMAGSAFEKIAMLAQRLVAEFGNNEEHRKFLIVLAEMGMRHPEVRQQVVEAHENYVDLIGSQLQRGIDNGEIREINPRMTALVLKMLIDGIEQAFALGYDLDVENLIITGLDMVLNGIRPVEKR